MKTTPSASLRLRAATLMLALAACHVPAHANMEICEGPGGCNGTSNSNGEGNGNNTNYNSGELQRPVMVRAQPATSLQKSVSRFSGGMIHLRQQVIEQNKTSKAQ